MRTTSDKLQMFDGKHADFYYVFKKRQVIPLIWDDVKKTAGFEASNLLVWSWAEGHIGTKMACQPLQENGDSDLGKYAIWSRLNRWRFNQRKWRFMLIKIYDLRKKTPKQSWHCGLCHENWWFGWKKEKLIKNSDRWWCNALHCMVRCGSHLPVHWWLP